MTAFSSGDGPDAPPSADYDLTGLVDALAKSHRSGTLAALGTHLVPPDLRSAFDVQNAVVQSLNARLAGWKLAITPHGCVAAPLLADRVIDQAQVWSGHCAHVTGVEVEIAAKLKADIAPERLRDLDWLHKPDLIEGPIIGMELVGGRYRRNASAPFTAFVADNLGNAGYVVGGPADGDVVSALGKAMCRVEVDGRIAFDGIAQHPNGSPFDVLNAALAELQDVLPMLRAGQILTMGSICGVVPVDRPRLVKATIGAFGEIQCRFAAHGRG